jgi:hypothetical protein
MSDFCDLVPNDPSCTTAPPTGGPDPAGPPGGGEDWDMMEKMGKMDSPMSWEDVDEYLDLWMNQ